MSLIRKIKLSHLINSDSSEIEILSFLNNTFPPKEELVFSKWVEYKDIRYKLSPLSLEANSEKFYFLSLTINSYKYLNKTLDIGLDNIRLLLMDYFEYRYGLNTPFVE